jgi:outer membrane protein assembly factor BamB
MKALLLLATVLTVTHAADWPQWRGPSRDGIVTGEKWPDTLDAQSLTKIWRVELQPSYSGPIVVGDRVFVTETVAKKIERIRALDRATGKEIWQHTAEGALSVPFFAKSNGDWIRSTPACDGETLFVAGMRDVLTALDAKTGAVRWRMDFCAKYNTPLPSFGFVCSPLVDGDSIYVQAGAGFCRLDKKTGEITWRTLVDDGGMNGSAFSSPVLATIAGKRQLIVQTRTHLAGVEPAGGTVLWKQEIAAFRGMNIITPVVQGDTLITSAYGGKTTGWKLTSDDGKWSLTQQWQHKSQGYMTTPVVLGDIAYTHLRSQRMMAIGILDGAEKWTSTEGFGKYVSLVGNRDKLLALDERGILFLIRATPGKYEKLAQHKLTENDTWAHLAACGETLFIRDLNGITAWNWK